MGTQMTRHTAPAIEPGNSLEDEAFDWLERLKERPGLTDEQRAQFNAWLLSSPQHVAQFLEELALDEALDVVRRARERNGVQADLDHWIAVARAAVREKAENAPA